MATEGFAVHRTTINSDITLIIESGIDVVTMRSSPNKYFIASRTFEMMELKMLIDAVTSSKFITEKKTANLIEKITRLSSKTTAFELQKTLGENKVIKPINEKIYYNVDVIVEAMQNEKCISFQYWEYTAEKKRIFKHDGYVYHLCPYTTFWRDDHYYVVGYSKKHEKITVFRIDRMGHTSLTEDLWIAPPDGFDSSIYANEVFEMFDGVAASVELKCANHLMNVIVDKFGEDVETEVLDDEHFKAVVNVHLSPRFYGWLFGFSGQISILSPINVKNEFIELAKKVVLSE
ncbi:WYL domain-containing protein [Chakrabartyella piscis]|uniref:helix-turn-helix transcriptional regulator n=1 Tax=Chakrabartyella piscis TaxID=2918914 RepID=UPI002958859A|nr:WYL domain-containing protein [Chakrabartyella piscis]